MTSNDSPVYTLTMCTKYNVCGSRHQAKWRVSKIKRNRLGQFITYRPLLKFFFGIAILGSVSMIGVNTIWSWAKSLEKNFVVENSIASEIVDKEDRIAYLIDKIYQKARIYKVSGYQMERTIECESRFNNIQSSAKDKYGKREQSWGIAQIHLPSHPEVRWEDAMTEEFAIEWMAQHFNDPNVTWYAYNRKLDKCNYE